jgi:hypothetical protein
VVVAAAATSVSFALYALGHLLIVRRRIPLPARPLLGTFARSALAALAMAGVLAAFGVATLAPVEWVAGLVLGPGAFAAVLVATGEVSWAQVRAAPALLQRRLGRREEVAAG